MVVIKSWKVSTGKTIKFVIVDCTKQDAKVQKLLKENDVKGFPTIKMKAGGKTYDFEAKVTKPALEQFLQSVLN